MKKIIVIAIFAGCLYAFFQSLNFKTQDKVNWANKNLNSALSAISDYFYYYNKKDFRSVESRLLYYPQGIHKDKHKDRMEFAFNHHNFKFGKYLQPKFQNKFEYLPICNKDFRGLARVFMNRSRGDYKQDKFNLLNTYCVDTSKTPNELYIYFTTVYEKGTNEQSYFVLVPDKKGSLKILQFPSIARDYEFY